jgi:hypothetical protein
MLKEVLMKKILNITFLTTSLLFLMSCGPIVTYQAKGIVVSTKSNKLRNLKCLELNLVQEANLVRTICDYGDNWSKDFPEIGSKIIIDYQNGFTIYGSKITNIQVIE